MLPSTNISIWRYGISSLSWKENKNTLSLLSFTKIHFSTIMLNSCLYIYANRKWTLYFRMINIEYSTYCFQIIIYMWEFIYSLNSSSISNCHLSPHLPYNLHTSYARISSLLQSSSDISKSEYQRLIWLRNFNAPGTALVSWRSVSLNSARCSPSHLC